MAERFIDIEKVAGSIPATRTKDEVVGPIFATHTQRMSELKEGMGPFSTLGIKVFDDFWINYMTLEMSRSAKLKKPPYSNLKDYLKYRNIKNL